MRPSTAFNQVILQQRPTQVTKAIAKKIARDGLAPTAALLLDIPVPAESIPLAAEDDFADKPAVIFVVSEPEPAGMVIEGSMDFVGIDIPGMVMAGSIALVGIDIPGIDICARLLPASKSTAGIMVGNNIVMLLCCRLKA